MQKINTRCFDWIFNIPDLLKHKFSFPICTHIRLLHLFRTRSQCLQHCFSNSCHWRTQPQGLCNRGLLLFVIFVCELDYLIRLVTVISPWLVQRCFPHHEAAKAAMGKAQRKEACLTEKTHKIDLVDCLFWDLLARSASSLCFFHLAVSWHTIADVAALAHVCTMELEEDGLSGVTHSG